MNHLISLKSILVHTTCITGLLFLTSSCSESIGFVPSEINKYSNMDKLATNDTAIVVIKNDNDAKFIKQAAEMQLQEIRLGKLAQQKGKSSHVKDLGKMMEDDHTTSMNELKALAKSKSITLPAEANNDAKDDYTMLERKSGDDFDKAYSAMMVEHHEEAISLFERGASEAKDDELKAWSSKKLSTLRTHLQHAEDCEKKLAKK